MAYYLGVDGGGSKTYALVADERGNVVGKGASGNGNHQLGAERAKRHLFEAVEAALAEAGVTAGEIERACFGLAGADREADFRVLRPMIAELGIARSDIVCDTMIGLRAGTSRPCGVVLICGSGTNAAGRNASGETFQCGGFEYEYGDFGGGRDLAVEAYRAVIRAWEGREEPTLLTGMLLELLGYGTVNEMFHDFLDHGRTVPLDAVKLLFRASLLGDETARAILRRQGEELGKSARAVIRRLGMEEETFDVVLVGSVLTRGEGTFVTGPIEEAVRGIAPFASIVKLGIEPVVGAVWTACEAGGESLPDELEARLRRISDFRLIGHSGPVSG
ncbi:N-acetylglucosamine kinase [Cohnella zeiphila]|uniref:ATPase n=1 Tax=Cohnella zeiphila TaxID=2761120 RepID=A0A7X0VX56_9BACL|nr:BadF/BadG/BcrA/BcrD ATPase family protein [Cohnella zeiphila]MBB6733117.1 ATPase [Cohnella zeiphila]